MFHGAREREWPLAKQLELIGRAAVLRKARRIPIVLAERGQMFVCQSEVDPWGTRRRLTWGRLEAMVQAAEAAGAPARKEPGVERGVGNKERQDVG
jgi:hypothetical protein